MNQAKPKKSGSYPYREAPGHLLRRVHQLSVAHFTHLLEPYDLTPVQFAVLNALIDSKGQDQATIADQVALDPATFGAVVARLEARGRIKRTLDPKDRRRRLLQITPSGKSLIANTYSAVSQVQTELLAPLTTAERQEFVRILKKLSDQ